MYRYLVVLFVASCWCQGDIDDITLQEIFGPLPGSSGDVTNNNGIPTTPPLTSAPLAPLTPVPTTPPAPAQPVTEANSEAIPDVPCVTSDNAEGRCVPYYLCSENNTIISDGNGIIDIRLKSGECAKELFDTCCALPSVRPPNNPITQAPPIDTKRVGCGWRNPNGIEFRITGATDGEANFGEFPWMVAILTIEPVNENEPNGQKINIYTGGGSLIHPSVVLTAAHNIQPVWGKKTIRARAGEWDTQTKREVYPYQDRQVIDVDIHKDFNKGNLFYDIAVLFVESPFDLNAPNVRLVCLPPPREQVPEGTKCFASGWGKDNFEKEGRYQVILKKIEVPVVKHDKCQSLLRMTRLGNVFMLHSSFMCAGGEKDKDACKGDGGSPLVCPVEFEEDRYMQSGIVAWGIGCGQDGTPGVYVDVSNLRDWIDNAVRGKGHDSQLYTV